MSGCHVCVMCDVWAAPSYVSERDVGWKPFMDTWIDARADERERSTLLLLFNKYVKNNDIVEKVFWTVCVFP